MTTQNNVLELKERLRNIEARLTNPMASDETIRELLKTKNELVADIQTLEIQLQKETEATSAPKTFERLLNEGEEQYGVA